MSSLDQRGDIAIALVVVYPFVFLLALILVIRHGFMRQAGWLFLMLFATAKTIGAILHIAAELQTTPSIGLYIGALAVEGAGIGPLLECTLSFLGTIGSVVIETHPIVTRLRLRLVHLLSMTAVVLFIVGAVQATSDDESTRNTASTLRKVGGILFAVVLGLVVSIHLLFWVEQRQLTKMQRTLLKGISCAVPFLTVRVLYSTLGGFAPASAYTHIGSDSSTSGLAKFSSISGSWEIYLVMNVLMEFAIVSIYIFFGLRLPISKGIDYEAAAVWSPNSSSIPLHAQPQTYSPPKYPQYSTNVYPSGNR